MNKLLVASVGDVRLMPSVSGEPCLVVAAKNGYVRTNASWVIERILGDYESWMDPAVRSRLDQMLTQRHEYMRRKSRKGTSIPRPGQTGLCVSVYEPSKSKIAGRPSHKNLVYWSGLVVATVQVGIAAIPYSFFDDWSILIITIWGTILAFVTGGLPQWKREKWACRRKSNSAYILTGGNGTQHAILILGNGHGLNLEDLAVRGQTIYRSSNIMTRLCLSVISIMWIGLMVTAAGVTQHTWYLLAVGSIGILENVFVASWRRNPSALGVHLDFRAVFGEMTTMDSLLALEAKHTGAGRSLLPIFFPGELRPEETGRWNDLKEQALQKQEQELARQEIQEELVEEAAESWAAHAKSFERKRK